ncbi:MAG: glycosyltransferase [Mycobacteriales bacterium]
MQFDVWHNDMWPRYKAAVFSELWTLAKHAGVDVRVFQIAEVTDNRSELATVDHSLHRYPHDNLFRMPYSEIPRIALIYKLCRIAWSTRADLTILHCYDKVGYWLQAVILLLRGRAFAVFCDSTINDKRQIWWKGLAKRVFFSVCRGGFCYGLRSAAYLRHYGMKASRIFADCQAAWLPPEYAADQIPARREAHRAGAERIRYLFVGRLAPEKGLDTLIRAFALVRQAAPEAKLVIVGAGPEEPNLRAQAQALAPGDAVEIAGARSGDALWSEYLKASCLVLPSRSEPWGLVANEALSHGCPVIASDRCGCVPELIAEGRSGMVFRCDDVDDLADKLGAALRLFPDDARVTAACLDQVAPYTAANAARAILGGACALVGFGIDAAAPAGGAALAQTH